MTTKPRIFISYARKDGRDLALRLQADLSPDFEVWLDTSAIGGGDSWSREIEEAINTCEIFLALMSGGSFTSEICRGEQLRALRLKKRVIPLLVQSETDRPIYLEGANYQDFSDSAKYPDALAKLKEEIRTGKAFELKADFQQTHVHITESLPSIFIPRPAELEALRKIVLSDATDRQIALTAIKGMGGIGKSVLAIALCHDEIVQAAFPDGIVWVKIGRENVDLTDKMKAIGTAFGDVIANYQSFDTARVSIANLLANKSALIVLDDVWEAEHLKPLLVNAPRCRTLFTTRDGEIALAMGASQYNLGMLHPDQALKLLEEWAERTDEQFSHIAERLGYLPLALQLVGAQFRRGVTSQEWLTSFEKVSQIKLGRRSQQPEENLKVCLDLSVNRLPEDDRPLYHSLGVFPEDVWIPEAVVSRLWIGLQPDLTPSDCTDVLQELEALSLIERNTTDKTISMHDLLHSYNREMLGEQFIPTHEALLSAYNPEGKPWYEIPHDGYLYFQLAYHLIQAGRKSELIQLLVGSPEWMQQKYIACVGDTSLVQDLELAWADYVDPLTPKQVLDLAQLHTLRQVMTARMHLYTDEMLKTLANLGRTEEALIHARLRSNYGKQAEGLFVIFDTLHSQDQANLTLLTEIHQIALKIEPAKTQVELLSTIAKTMAQQGDERADGIFTQAVGVANTIESFWSRTWALSGVAQQMAQAGQFEPAMNLASQIEEIGSRAWALSKIAQTMTIMGDERADSTLTQAMRIVEEIENVGSRTAELGKIAFSMVQVGQFEPALRVAIEIENVESQAWALSRIARAMINVEDKRADHTHARAMRIAGEIEDGRRREMTLSEIAEQMAQARGGQAEIPTTTIVADRFEEIQDQASVLDRIANQLVQMRLFEQALEVANQIELMEDRANTLSKIAEQMVQMGLFEQALEVANKIEEVGHQQKALSGIATALAEMGLFGSALGIVDKVEEARSHALALAGIAKGMAKVGDKRANSTFSQALEIADELEKAWNRVEVLSRVAEAMAQMELFEQALDALTKIKEVRVRANVLTEIALVMAKVGDERANSMFTQALRAADEIEETWNRVKVLSGIAQALAQTGQFGSALAVTDQIDEVGHLARTLSKIANTMDKMGDNRSETIFTQALEIADTIQDAGFRTWTLSAIAGDMAKVGQIVKVFQIIPIQKEPVKYLETLVELQPTFEQIETGLSLKVLREATRIVAWIKPAWAEIHEILIQATQPA